jgi:hypothetical protein
MTDKEALKKMYQLLLTEPHAPTVCLQLEAIAREVLAQPEQEPVGYVYSESGVKSAAIQRNLPNGTPLFTTPPQRTEQEPVAWEQFYDPKRVQDMLQDVSTMGSAWSRGGERIDPMSVYKGFEPEARPENNGGKPTAWYDPSNGVVSTDRDSPLFTPLGQVWPLYPKGEWVGLTLEQYVAINSSCTTVDQAVGSTERQLKENNT